MVFERLWIDEEILDSWRSAIISPILTKGSPADAANYRGIFILRTCYRILERLMTGKVQYRDQRTRDEQANFRPGRSTIDQIVLKKRCDRY